MPAVKDVNNRNLPLEKYAGKTLYACASGESLDGYAYMVTFRWKLKAGMLVSDCIWGTE